MASPLYRPTSSFAYLGYSRSVGYRRIAEGLLPPPVKISERCVAWPLHELEALNAATIAGKPPDEIRALVRELIAARKAPAVPVSGAAR